MSDDVQIVNTPKKRGRPPKNPKPISDTLSLPKVAKTAPCVIIKTKEQQLAELQDALADLDRKHEELKSNDPFWFYEPSDGTLGEDGFALMTEFLHPEDIPSGRLDSQKDVHFSDKNIVLAAGGNQTGKTTVGAIEAFIKATGEVPFSMANDYPKSKIPKKRPNHVRVVGVDHQTFMRNLLPTYQKWVPREYLSGGSWEKSYNSEGRILKLGKGGELFGTIEFMTNEQDVRSFQGPPRHKIIYDEEPRSDIYRENLMRFSTADSLDVLFCMTPTEGMSWVKEEILDKEFTSDGAKIACFKVPSVTNKKVNTKVLRSALQGMSSYEEVKMRLLGEFVSLSGLVYGNLFNTKVHVIEPFFEHLSNGKKRDYLCLSGWDLHTVTPHAGVFILLDREGNVYVDRSYYKQADTTELKSDVTKIIKDSGYRMGWSVADKSSNSNIIAFGGRNIYKEVSTGKNAIPGLRTSEKFEGSIRAGVDQIKQKLKINPLSGKPSLFVVNRPENKLLIQSFKNLERDTYANEDIKGMKDRIREGKHHNHAALRYIFQYPMNWYSEHLRAPEPVYMDAEALA